MPQGRRGTGEEGRIHALLNISRKCALVFQDKRDDHFRMSPNTILEVKIAGR